MHIAIDARLYGLKHAGIGRYTQNLLRELSVLDQSNHYTIITSDTKSLTSLPKHHTIISTSIRHYTLSEQTNFLKLINQIDADLFHFPHFNVPYFYSKPFIVTIHDLLWHEKIGFNATTLNPAKYIAKYFGYRLIMNHAATGSKHILTPANTVKQTIIKTLHVNPDKITITHEAADQVYSHPSGKTKHLLTKFQLDSPFIIYTGSLYPHKNVQIVLEALKLIPHLNFAIASARNIFSDQFKAKIKQFGLTDRVKLLGFVKDSDLAALYQEAVALVQPSQSEGFGLTGLEAMASGLPVICSSHPTLKEIYNQAAIYADTTSAVSLASKLQQLLTSSSTRAQYSTKGRQQSSLYSWQKTASQTLKVYTQFGS